VGSAVHTSSALLLHFVKVKGLFSSKIYSFEALVIGLEIIRKLLDSFGYWLLFSSSLAYCVFVYLVIHVLWFVL